MNAIDQRAVVLAESFLCGEDEAKDDLKKILSTVGISNQAHDEIKLTLGKDGYREVVS